MLEAVGAKVRLLRRVREGSLTLGDIPEGVDTDFQLIGCESGFFTGLSIEIDERPEPGRFATNDGDHERKPQRPCPDK